jgi:hypothetical protein
MYNLLIRCSKKMYYANALEVNSKNLKKTWAIINEAISNKGPKNPISEIFFNGITINNPFDIAQKFNQFFTSIAANLSTEINPSDLSIDDTPSLPVTLDELLSTINCIQDKKTPDFNNISMHLVKKSIVNISAPLIHIFNCSLTSGRVPDKMKIAKVVPIFKSGNANDINSYRPISLLCTFSKFLRKL